MNTYVLSSAKPHAGAATVAQALAVSFGVIVALLHVVRGDLRPASHVLSEYALGSTGWMMALAFFALAGSFAALLIALWADLRGALGVLGGLALLAAAVGALMGGLFPMDPVGTLPENFSTRARLYNVAFMLGGPGVALAALLVNWRLAQLPAWRQARVPLAVTAALVWLATALFGYSMSRLMAQGPSGPEHFDIGWFNRGLVLAWIVWVFVLATVAKSVPRAADRRGST